MIKLLLLAIFEDVTKCFSNPRPRRVKKIFWERLFLNNNLLKNNWIRLQYWQKIWTCCIKKHSSVFFREWLSGLLNSIKVLCSPTRLFLCRNHASAYELNTTCWKEIYCCQWPWMCSWTPTKNFGTFWKRLSIFGTFWNQHLTINFQSFRIFLTSILAIFTKLEPLWNVLFLTIEVRFCDFVNLLP